MLAGEQTIEQIVLNPRRVLARRAVQITGLRWARLDVGPQGWPWPEGAAQGQERWYADGIFPTANGRARFAAAPYKPVAEPRDARFP